MGVDSGILQNCSVLQTQLPAKRGANQKFALAAIAVIIHREGSAVLDLDDALYHGVLESQLAAVLYHDADTAEDLHIYKGQIAAAGNIECLGNFIRQHIIPGDVIAEITVCAAGVGAIPGFHRCWDTDTVLLSSHIAAKVLNGPGLHDVPHIPAVLRLLQVLQL